MNDTISKAVSAASQVLKGEKPGISAAEFESAMIDYAKSRCRDGESCARALVRLLDERDDTIAKLALAVDIARVREGQPNKERAIARATVHKQATEMLDEHVELHKRDGESVEQCAARLARGDVTFVKLWEALRAANS